METSQKIRNYIDNNTSEIFDSEIKDEKELVFFYHLSEMRKSLYNWYDFRNDGKLLEVGAGFGALTGLFCEKCASVTALAESEYQADAIRVRHSKYDNLSVYGLDSENAEADFEDNSDRELMSGVIDGDALLEALDRLAGEKFDYIVLTGILERISSGREELLMRIKGLLAPKGKLLIATENRYGMKYLCGEREDVSGIPFAGLRNGGVTRQGLISLVCEAGFSKHKFFYPLPDYRFPLQVYTDEYLPQKNIGERVLFYHDGAESLVADEKLLYSDIIDNGVFPFVANSFLIECMADGSAEDLSDVSFVALTTDRGPEAALTTVIKRDAVEKKPLYSEGLKSIQEVLRNVQEMKERGLSVIDHEFDGSVIRMPYIEAPALMDYMRTISDDREKISDIFELLWTMILQSSDEVPANENRIKEYGELGDEVNWGPILKKVYIEMMPMNCFYIDGQISFFDQEFAREYFPAKYAMYRAVFYTYVNIPEIEKVLPAAEIKAKYGFEDKLWNAFMAEESRFVEAIRRLSDNAFFYDRLRVDEAKMQDNAKRLML
ncbi:MAG: methyltransferase domain-containing protein [Butyrivibrio sp.]|nr:methyltransferase domain-containing protein [Butyrivibrio sp.]